MAPQLRLPDAEGAGDVLTFAGRAARLGEDAAVRLQAARGVLAMTTAVLAPRGLLDASPTVLALRAVPVDPELECDLVVTASALTDGGAGLIDLPETAVSAAWAGVAPPRSGWTDRGAVAASVLAARAQWGSAAVADRVPRDAGEDAVRSVRTAVWGAPDDELGGMPLGVAFGAFTMGFVVGDEQASIRECGPWTRVSLHRGHVLVRGPVRSGLTEVRSTGPGR